LTKKEIRTQYSGFILFTAKLLTVATGIAYALIIARSVTQSEYGVWGTLNIIIPYFTLLSSAFPFWIMRFVARDKEGATKTGILANMIIAAIATLVYIALLPLIITAFRFEDYIMLYSIAAAQIIEIYLIAVLEAALSAQRPHFVGYGLLVGDVCKVLLAYIFIIELQLSLLGAVISIIIAFAIKIAFYFKTVLKELQNKIVFGYIKEWVKGSAFNIYNLMGDRIAAVVFLMLPMYGGEIATSYYQAAVPIANIITYSSLLAFALYPKILAGGKIEDATTSLKMVLMFTIPMTTGVIALPDSYLIILRDVYIAATPVLIILTADALILTVSSFFMSVLYGIEKIDEKGKIMFKQVAKSRLFIAFSLPYIHSAITLPTTFYVLTNFTNNQPLLVATYVTAINTAAHLAMFIVLYFIVRKAVKVKIPWKSIAKYVFASTTMASILFIIPHPTKIHLTLGVTAMGGIIYISLLMIIDKEARLLANSAWREIKFMVRGIST
jgi:O-antigen/teichoic acid export membrane protein